MDTGEIKFIHVIDACTYHGPRNATTEDMEEHPAAWKLFEDGTDYLPPGSVPLVSFITPEGTPDPEPVRAKGSKAPA